RRGRGVRDSVLALDVDRGARLRADHQRQDSLVPGHRLAALRWRFDLPDLSPLGARQTACSLSPLGSFAALLKCPLLGGPGVPPVLRNPEPAGRPSHPPTPQGFNRAIACLCGLVSLLPTST